MRGMASWQHRQSAIALPGTARLPLCGIRNSRRHCTSVSLRKLVRNGGRRVSWPNSRRCANRVRSASIRVAARADAVAEAPIVTTSSFEGWRQKGSEAAHATTPSRSQLKHSLLLQKHGVEFEAEYPAQDDLGDEDEAVVAKHPEVVLKTIGCMRREDYAVGMVGVVCLALGVAATKSVAVKGSGYVRSALTSLQQQNKGSASTAEDWLQGFVDVSQKQAATFTEALKEWPDLVQRGLEQSVQQHHDALRKTNINLSEWAEQHLPGRSDIQRLWTSAADAAQQHLANVSEGVLPTKGGTDVSPRTASEASISQDVCASPARSQRRAPADAEVFAQDSRTAAKAAEDRWNERIKAAYASVAATTPFRPQEEAAPKTAAKATATPALSYARGGNTTLMRPDFKPLPTSRQLAGSGGSGSGSRGNDGGGHGGGRGGKDPGSEDEEQPNKRQPQFLWGRALLAAGAAAAAVEQLLQWPRSRGKILALLAFVGALAAWQGFKAQYQRIKQRRRRARVQARFALSSPNADRMETSAGYASDLSSDDEGF